MTRFYKQLYYGIHRSICTNGNNIIRERRGDRKALFRPFLFWFGVVVCILGMVTAALAQSTAPLKMSAIPVGLFFLIYFVFFKLREDE